ncbi:receptor activity-modifying protein 2 [Stigmatopora nigra]
MLGNMASSYNRRSLIFAVCFLLLGAASFSSVCCLVDEKLSVQSATTAAYYSTETINMASNATFGDMPSQIACAPSSINCSIVQAQCHVFFGGPNMECLYALFDSMCLCNFEVAMATMNASDWCAWSNVSGLYSSLSLCTETISDCLEIWWPNPLVEQTFVDIHQRFFKDCPTEELSDPAPPIVFALVITPILLIPVMVSLVVLKTKNGDGSS